MSILGTWMRKEADKLSTARINSFEGKPFASNDYSKICAKAFELNKFKFLKIAVIGPLNVNTDEGCKVIFEMDGKELPEIESDSTEIKTDFSDTLGVGFTEFDIDLSDELNSAILSASSAAISITVKGGFVKFLVKDTTLLKAALDIAPVAEEEAPDVEGEENKDSGAETSPTE